MASLKADEFIAERGAQVIEYDILSDVVDGKAQQQIVLTIVYDRIAYGYQIQVLVELSRKSAAEAPWSGIEGVSYGHHLIECCKFSVMPQFARCLLAIGVFIVQPFTDFGQLSSECGHVIGGHAEPFRDKHAATRLVLVESEQKLRFETVIIMQISTESEDFGVNVLFKIWQCLDDR